jgi:hypothetical protein
MTTGIILFHALPPLLAVSIGRIVVYAVVGLLALAVLLVVLFQILFIITCLCERQYLAGDTEPANEPYPYPPSPYWRVTRKTAFEAGLQHAGDFATKQKKGLVKCLEALFISPDNQVILMISSGAAAVAKDHRTIVRTQLNTGRILESCDTFGTRDLSGVIERDVLLNAGIAELMEFHRERIRKSGAIPVAFGAGTVREEFDRITLEKGARWVTHGFARWADQEHTSIRMTFLGAWAQMSRLFSDDPNKQRSRVHIRRAGSQMRN